MRRDQGVSFALGIGAVAGVRVVAGVLVKMGSDTHGTTLSICHAVLPYLFASDMARHSK